MCGKRRVSKPSQKKLQKSATHSWVAFARGGGQSSDFGIRSEGGTPGDFSASAPPRDPSRERQDAGFRRHEWVDRCRVRRIAAHAVCPCGIEPSWMCGGHSAPLQKREAPATLHAEFGAAPAQPRRPARHLGRRARSAPLAASAVTRLCAIIWPPRQGIWRMLGKLAQVCALSARVRAPTPPLRA